MSHDECIFEYNELELTMHDIKARCVSCGQPFMVRLEGSRIRVELL